MSINLNLENLTVLLEELDFHFMESQKQESQIYYLYKVAIYSR